MTEYLLKTFVKNKEQVKDNKVRQDYGMLSSIVGIISNVILFIVKFILGSISNSISITSDGFNNLSDAASCIVTLFGFKLSNKPADKDHPFGHGRMEYLTSMLISVVILGVGYNLFKESIDKVIHPDKVQFSMIVLVSLIVSIGIKVWLSLFNKKLGNAVDSTTMLATSKDSLNDVVATTATIISLIVSMFTSFPIDGIMGVIVSLFIFYSGIEIMKDTVDILLGKPVSDEFAKELEHEIVSNKYILGLHDLIIHNYGPGRMMGSVHVEVDSKCDIIEVHDTIDEIERLVYNKYQIILTIHMDPVVIGDKKTDEIKEYVKEILSNLDKTLQFHDFRIVSGPSHTNVLFDIVLPFDCKISKEDIKKHIEQELNKKDGNYYCIITFDISYIN